MTTYREHDSLIPMTIHAEPRGQFAKQRAAEHKAEFAKFVATIKRIERERENNR